MTFCYIILFCSSLLPFIMPLITPFHSSKTLVPGTSFFPAPWGAFSWNNINIHFPDSCKHASQFLTSFPRTFSHCLGCFIIYNCSTSQTSIKHLMSATAFFCIIQVVSFVTTMTTHLEKSSFWFTLGKTSSFLFLSRHPFFLSNRKLVCCLGTWTSGVNTKFNLVLLSNQQFQEQVGWISLPWECKECPDWEILGFELSWCSVTSKCPVFLQHNVSQSNSRR